MRTALCLPMALPYSETTDIALKMKKLNLFELSWPLFIETLLFLMLGFVDVFVLSKYDELAASAINTANQAISIVTIVFTVISGASAILIAQYLGADRTEDASRIGALSISFNLITGIVISALLVAFSEPILVFIGAKGNILRFAREYLVIVGGTVFFQSVMNAMTVILRNHGLTRITMYISVGMNVINTALDVVLVLGLFGMPRMGVVGVAVATVLSRLLGLAVVSVYLFTKVEKLSVFRRLMPFPKKDLADIIRIGVPSAMETFLYNLSQLVITSFVLSFLTETELVTKTYVQNITTLFYIFSVSIGQASQIIVGQMVGAKEYDKAYRQGVRSHTIALAITVGLSITGIILRTQLMGIFSEDPAVISIGSDIIILNIILELGRTTNLVLIACLRSAGDVYFPTIWAIFSMWVISVLGCYILAVVLGMGIYGLWIALTADECFRGIMMTIRWHRGTWKKKRVIS